jgi:hypothetical protein
VRSAKPIKFFDFRTRQIRDVGTVQNEVLPDIPGLSISSDGRRLVWGHVGPGHNDKTRDQIDRRHGFGLGLVQARFEHGGDAAEPQLS